MAKQSVGAGDRGRIIANILQVFLIIVFLIIIFLIIVNIFQVFLLQTMYDAFIKTKIYMGLGKACPRRKIILRQYEWVQASHAKYQSGR